LRQHERLHRIREMGSEMKDKMRCYRVRDRCRFQLASEELR
jgi:hypothetical protein